MIRLTAVVSGGQTGADRGGLDAAIQLGLGYGGWAPKGWRAEDGQVPEIYRAHMRESASPEYGMRTRLNVQDSDGTLIVSFGRELTGGSKYTAEQARAQKKPCKHLELPAGGRSRVPDAVRAALLEWVEQNQISVLNVAGPRESKEPGLQAAVRDALVWIFEDEVEEQLAELAMRIHAAGGEPDHVAIPPENVDTALAAGLDVQISSEHAEAARSVGLNVQPMFERLHLVCEHPGYDGLATLIATEMAHAESELDTKEAALDYGGYGVHAPPRVGGDEKYWSEPPPERSARCSWWVERINRGWRRNRRIASMGYYTASEYFGVHIWEYINVLSPRLSEVEK